MVPVTLNTVNRYAFTIDVFPLQDNAANNLEVAVDIYDPAWSAFNRSAYAAWHPSWLPLQEDYRLSCSVSHHRSPICSSASS